MSEVVAEAPTIAEISHSCPCAYVEGAPAGYMWKDIDTGNESDVLRVWTTAQETADRCYNASYWQLTGPTGKTYHFLEHMGTQALAYDLELLRRALGETQWSFYGASYGTAVAAVYASAFPERVSKIVLDGNAVPMPNLEWWGAIWGNTVAVVIDRMLENCRQQPACVLKDPFAAYRSVLAALHSKQLLSPPCARWRGAVATAGWRVCARSHCSPTRMSAGKRSVSYASSIECAECGAASPGACTADASTT
jgi:pimeloyl-ACP methyl ester carboxylesterase